MRSNLEENWKGRKKIPENIEEIEQVIKQAH